jgi:Ubiquitin carboxyl-terminal hydrolase
MPSVSSHFGLASTLETISDPSLTSSALKSLVDTPLHFEKATLPQRTGLNGQYVPLNRLFSLGNGTANGMHNGDIKNENSAETKGSETNGQVDDRSETPVAESSPNGVETVSTEWPRILMRPPGLKNYQNTCYMNSTLQVLMHVPPLVSYLLSKNHTSIC